MDIHYVEDIFSDDEIKSIKNRIKENRLTQDIELGRAATAIYNMNPNIERKIEALARKIYKADLKFSSIVYVEYNNTFGQPKLNPHFDGDDHDLVFDYQLESNTSWDLGLGTKVYPIKDNSAIIFNANQHIHWRPYKEFKDGQYVKMLFFRLYNTNRTDYSHLNYMQDDPIFDEVKEFRESLNQ